MDPLLLFPQTGRLGVRVPTNGLREAPRCAPFLVVLAGASRHAASFCSPFPAPPSWSGTRAGHAGRLGSTLDPRATEKVSTFLTPAPQAPHLPQPSRLPPPPRSETPGFLTG